jgi:hypothetical protein
MFRWLDKGIAAGLAVCCGGVLQAQGPTVFRDTVTQVHVIASVKNISKGES